MLLLLLPGPQWAYNDAMATRVFSNQAHPVATARCKNNIVNPPQEYTRCLHMGSEHGVELVGNKTKGKATASCSARLQYN